MADISQTALSNVCSFCLNDNKSSLVKVMAGQTAGVIAKKFSKKYMFHPLQWRHNERLKSSAPRLFTQPCVHQRKPQSSLSLASGNSPMTGEFPTRRASNAENVSISWCHNGTPENNVILRLWYIENTLWFSIKYVAWKKGSLLISLLHCSNSSWDIPMG